MSREIKFRAWLKLRWDDDEDANRMYYDIQNSYDTLGNVKPYDPMDSFSSWFDDDVAIVEQYTGLKDKNGKEIYEGDIVKARWRRAKHARLDTKGEVKFNDGWFYISDDPDGQDRLGVPVHNCYNLEIIGNIHENPELLGGEE